MTMKPSVVKWWRKYVAEVGWPLNVVCVASLLVVCLHDFVFAGGPELFQNAGKLWDLVYQLSLAVLASYVFFYVNVHLPRQQDRGNIQNFLNDKTFRIVRDAWTIVEELQRHARGDDHGDAYISLSGLKTMCSRVSAHDEAPLFLGNLRRHANWIEYLRHANWIEYLVYFRNETKENAESIYSKITFLDSDYLKLIIDIDDCDYFSVLRAIGSAPMRNNDISFLANQMYDYLEKVWRLRDYAQREFGDPPRGGSYLTLFR